MKHLLHTPTSRLNKLWATVSRKNRILLGILGGGAAIVGIMLATAPQHDPTVLEEKIWPVSAMIVEPKSLSPELNLFGKVENPNHAQLTAAVSATVSQVNVVEGKYVTAGDVLVVLDDADESLRLQQRSADLVDAKSELEQTRRKQEADRAILKHMQELLVLSKSKAERLNTLQQRNLVATERLEDARQQVARQAIQFAQQQMTVDNHPQLLAIAMASVQRSESLYAEQELRLLRTTIRAPFDGRVSSVQVAIGDRIMVGQIAISIYDLASLRVRAAIPSSMVAALKQATSEGKSIDAQIISGEQLIPLSLDQLAAEVRQGRSGVDGLFKLDRSGNFLELGRAVDMTVIMPALDDVVALPVQSLYGNNRVYTVEEGRLQGIVVATLGQRVDEMGNFQTLVRSPALSLGTRVLTTTLPKASSGLRVEVIQEKVIIGKTPVPGKIQHI
jgi:multidrug efflux pump subunit AcrA (membrane-fusion protein)